MSENTHDQPLVITRTFNAPRQKVWDAFTKPEDCMKWWGPKDFTSPACKIDLRVGGKYLFCMQDKEGKKFWSTGTYKEINPIEKIVCTDSFSNENGDIVSAETYGMKDFPLELEVTFVFEDIEGSRTKLTLTHVGIPKGEIVEMTHASWNQCLDKLEADLK
ncbi:MAG: SRPBCC domain-containing protein [Patescibacteria group bacterium]